MMTEELDPRDALALAERTRDRMLERAATPPWYAPLYGLGCGLIVAGGGLPQPWGLSLVTFGILFVSLLYWRWTQSSGLSVNGYRAGTTRAQIFALPLRGKVRVTSHQERVRDECTRRRLSSCFVR